MDNRFEQHNEPTLRDYFNVLQRRWQLVAIVCISICILGLGYVFLQTPLYEGSSTVLIEPNSSQLSPLGDFSDFGSGFNVIETEMEIIKSRSISEEVVASLGLDAIPARYEAGKRVFVSGYSSTDLPESESPEFSIAVLPNNRFSVSHHSKGSLGTGEFDKLFAGKGLSFNLSQVGYQSGEQFSFKKIPFQSAVSLLRKNMEVTSQGKKTNIIKISVNLADPYLARDTADKITSVYVSRNIARKSQEASQMLDFIEQQIETIQGNLEKGEHELDHLKTEKGFFILSETAQKLIQQISHLEINRASITLQQQQVSQLIDKLSSHSIPESSYLLGQVSLPDPVASQLVGQLSQKLIELRALRQDLTDDHPRVAVAKAQVDELKAKIKVSVSNAKMSLDNQVATINQIIEGYENKLKTLPQAERQLAALMRKSEVNADLYTFLLKKHEEARISRAGVVGNARVIDPALVNFVPVSPRLKQTLALLLIIGLSLGIAFAFVVDYFDDSLRTVEEIENKLKLSAYGVIPYLAESRSGARVLITQHDSQSVIQEAFRSFRTNLQFSNTEKSPQTLLCTSAQPGVGKTTVNSNLAVSLAQSGLNVLLVDCDLRRPQVHKLFSIDGEPGLTNALLTGGDWQKKLIIDPVSPNLSILVAGTLPPNPAEFLGSKRFAEFVSQARQQFDYIVFDTPPVLAFTDAAILANHIDSVFFIIEAGYSRFPFVKRALDLLANVHANVQGTVLNKVKSGTGENYYYYSYNDYYGTPKERSPLRRLIDKSKGFFGSISS